MEESAKIEHIGLVVKDVDSTVELWSKLFGVTEWTRREVDTTDPNGQRRRGRFANCTLGPIRIELVQPIEGMAMQTDFLAKHGEGVHHIGFPATDVDAAAKQTVAKGARMVSATPGRVAFLEIGEKGGIVIEFVQRRA